MTRTSITNLPHTPLRYPGGKGKITQFVHHTLEVNHIDGTYVEPFAGGAGVAINLLLAGSVSHIVINDLDHGVHAFWKTLTTDPTYLIEQIKSVPFDSHDVSLSPEDRYRYWTRIHHRYELQHYGNDYKARAFDFFMLNRMNVSGVILGGPIGGKHQTGQYSIASRFTKTALIDRINAIAQRADAITVLNDEASYLCNKIFTGYYEHINPDNTLLFVDPPYYVQGRNLYKAFATETIHESVCRELTSSGYEWKWLVTYDDTDYIRNLYDHPSLGHYAYNITYSANKRGRFQELMFTSPTLHVESFNNVELRSV